ncbi:MAG: glutaredoxin family protein [Peptococcaceae bacterium]|nr:glutaredoxin family protein [Peptococcaceae bacterium]
MKEYFSQKSIDFVEIDVGIDQHAREEMINKTGSMSVPTIVIGSDVIIGFNRQKLDELLE